MAGSTTDELRVLLKTIADTGGADQVRKALRAVQDDARKSQAGIGAALGLSTTEGLLRTVGAVTGIGLGLNVAAGAATHLHDELAKGIQAAIDAAETASKLDVVFGRSSESVKALGKDAPQALGATGNAALAAAGNFGNLFTAMGLSRDRAAAMSVSMVQLAGDLASFHNIPVPDALLKLQSGLVGEAEPLRTLGVAINEAQVQTKALALGLGDANGDLSEAAKVQARYALILEQTKSAQGDFARTSDSLANRQRVAAATTAELGQKVGQSLTPAVSESTDAVLELTNLLGVVLPGAAQLAATGALHFLRPVAEDIKGINRDIQNLRAGDAARSTAPIADPARVAAAQREAGLAFDEQGQAVDALTGELLTFVQVTDRMVAAEKALGEQGRGTGRLLAAAGADIGFLDQKLGAAALSGGALDAALRKAAQATAEINAENRGPITHPVDALRNSLADRLAQMEDQRAQAGRQNADLAEREARARLALLPVQQQLADLDRTIAQHRGEALTLTREEAVLRAQQAANPASDRAEDVQRQQERLRLIIATTRGAERSAARRELRQSLRGHDLERAELGALDAGGPLVAAQRAARDTSLATQLATIPDLIQRARLSIDAQPLEAALEKVRSQIETDTTQRGLTLAALTGHMDSLADDIKGLDDLLSGKNTGRYVPGADRNINGGFLNLAGQYPTIRVQIESSDGQVWDQLIDASRGLGTVRIQAR